MSQQAFENRLAVVTGASSDIGLAVVEQLLDLGARVLAMSRSAGALDGLKARCGDALVWQPGDVTRATDLAALAEVAGTVNQRLLGGRFLEPEVVAEVILFLLSPAARGLYGQDLVVDSGYTLR
jgi:NAD(P)-dependent dehydrogenase (short-subunit alcohol dehydrogenase family)